MVETPKVSVILPTYNRKTLIGKSVQSILDQTYSDFELIIIDDASTDGTWDIINEFSDPRIICLKHVENRGGSAARNTGIDAAKGKYIAFQDSDDIWLPEKLAKQMSVFKNSPESTGVVYTRCIRWNVEQKLEIPGELPKPKNGDIFKALLPENFIVLPSVVLKKECFEKVGLFDETLPRLQDWDLFLRIAKLYEFCYVPEPLVQSFYTENSISSNPKALIRAFEIILEKYNEDYQAEKEILASQLFRLSILYRLESDIRNSRRYLVKTIKINQKPTFILGLLASFFGNGFFNFYWKIINRIFR